MNTSLWERKKAEEPVCGDGEIRRQPSNLLRVIFTSVKSHYSSHFHNNSHFLRQLREMMIRCWKVVCPQSMTVPAAFLRNSDAPVREFTSPDSRPGTDEGLQNVVLPFQFFRALQKASRLS